MMLNPGRSGSLSSVGNGETCKMRRRLLIVAVMALVVLASRTCFAEPLKVQTIYFVAKNRVARPAAIQAMKNFIKVAQAYYSTEMAKQGYFQPGTTKGKTFLYETDASGEPAVHIVYGMYDDTHYQGDRDIYWMAQNEVLQYYSYSNSTLLIWCETSGLTPDGALLGGACGGQSCGATGGIATMTTDGLYFADQTKFGDPTPYDGMLLPDFSPYPLKFGATFPDFCGSTVGQITSTEFGSTCHEIGHAFGLLHNFTNDSAPKNGGNLMGNGCRGFRGNYGGFPGEYAVLDPLNAELLNVDPYFNPDVEHTDYSTPYLNTDLSLVEPLSTNWKLHIKVNASDYGSGLHRSFATALPVWSPVASAPFNSNGVADYYVTPSQIPCPWDTPKAYTFEVNAVDNQGNRALVATWVPSSISGVGSKLEYLSGSTWTAFKNSWTTSNNVRLGITMVAPDGIGSMRAEVEVKPSGVPFTGNPNYTTDWTAWSGTPVTVYVPLNLACGKYHYRYHIKTDQWTISNWIFKGSESADTISFGIDNTAPTTPVVTDSGQYTDATNVLTGSWPSSDPESGIASYEVAVGTTPYDSGKYVCSWRIASDSTGAVAGLSLVNGTKYYIYARATNMMGVVSQVGVSDGITVRTDSPDSLSINQAKNAADGSYVMLEDVVASSGKNDLSNCFYVEQSDRTSGIQINTQDAGTIPDFAAGKSLTVSGMMSTVNGERAISCPEVVVGDPADQILPLGLNIRALGGGDCGLQKAVWSLVPVESDSGSNSQWMSSIGLSNIGLLVKIAGNVTQIDPAGNYFYIDDGSGLQDGTFTGTDANIGVRVVAKSAGYTQGQTLAVTGISSCMLGQNGNPIRMLKVRSQSDIKPL